MPGPALHHIIAEKLRAKILYTQEFNTGLSNAELSRLRDLLRDDRNLPYYFLGCQGPDPFFFNMLDWASSFPKEAVKLVDIMIEMGELMTNFRRSVKSAVPQPIWDLLDETAAAIDDTIEDSHTLNQIHGLFSDTSKTLAGLTSTVTEALKVLVTEHVNLFGQFDHPYRDGVSFEEQGTWWWFDAMHYRLTGAFAQKLLEKTRDISSPLHLYALGYLTHVAGDTVGHPYVNIISGGPYRSHSQRHKVGESFQDVFNMFTYNGTPENPEPDFNRDAHHAYYNFNYRGEIVTEDEVIFQNTEPHPDTIMPDDLAQLIAEALSEVYNVDGEAGVEYGVKELEARDIKAIYKNWFKWFRSATESGTLPPPAAFNYLDNIEDIWEKLGEDLEDVFENTLNQITEPEDILGLIWGLLNLAIEGLKTAVKIADAVAATAIALPAGVIRGAAGLVYEEAYNAYQNLRLMFSLNGLAFPMVEHLGDSRYRQFINPSNFESTENMISAASDTIRPNLPLQKLFTNPGLFTMEDPLIYPPTEGESRQVMGAPDSYFDAHAWHYICGDIPFTPNILQTLIDTVNNTKSEEGGHETAIQDLFTGKPPASLGNALTLTTRMYARWKSGKRLPDFNLDADRGYGYLCWAQSASSELDHPTQQEDLYPAELTTTPEVNVKFFKNE